MINNVFENFQAEEIEKQKKINLVLVIAEYNSHMKRGLETFLAAPKSQKISSAPFVNYCCCLRKGLEIKSKSTNFTSFINGPNIFNITPAIAKSFRMGCTL